MALDKDDDNARLRRGWANIQAGNPSAAERDFNFLIQQKKQLSAAHVFRGLARLMQFRDGEAQKDFAESRKIAEAENGKTADAEWKVLEEHIADAKEWRKKHKANP